MTSPYASITDGTTTIPFIGNPDMKPFVHTVGAAYNPLGYNLTVMSSSTIVRGVTATMIALDADTFKSTQAADNALQEMLMEFVPLTITWPDGSTITVSPDPATDPISSAQFSIWLDNYVNTWTVKFFEVDEA